MHIPIYTAWQWTWGIVQTAAGAALYLKHRGEPHFDYHGACVTLWQKSDCVSLGKFVFVTAPEYCGKDHFRRLLTHEYGHTVQSLILGPLYLPLVGLPSVVWQRAPGFRRMRKTRGLSYYAPPFEKTADILGEKFS